MRKKFLRRDWCKKIRLGGRRKKMVWRKPKGRDSKMRLKYKGYGKSPSVGYKKPQEKTGLVKGKKPIMITNVNELSNIKENNIGIISGSLGKKKKLEIAEKLKNLKVEISNFNAEKFLDDVKKEREKKEAEKKTKEKKKAEEAKARQPEKKEEKKEEVKAEAGEIKK